METYKTHTLARIAALEQSVSDLLVISRMLDKMEPNCLEAGHELAYWAREVSARAKRARDPLISRREPS